MTEYTVECQDEDTVLWSFTITADSKEDAAEKAVQDNLQSKDLAGVHVFVYETTESIYESTSFEASEVAQTVENREFYEGNSCIWCMEHNETLEVDGESLTVELEVESAYGTSVQKQTVSVSPGDTVNLRITDEQVL